MVFLKEEILVSRTFKIQSKDRKKSWKKRISDLVIVLVGKFNGGSAFWQKDCLAETLSGINAIGRCIQFLGDLFFGVLISWGIIFWG